jgi:hypothetical protein
MPTDRTILLDRQLKYWMKNIAIAADAKAVSFNEEHVSKAEQRSVKVNLIPFIPCIVFGIIYKYKYTPVNCVESIYKLSMNIQNGPCVWI